MPPRDDGEPLPPPPSRADRIAPSDATSDAIERIAPRRFQVEDGDVVMERERVPRVDPKARATEPPVWRYRVTVVGSDRDRPQVFNGFQMAASVADQFGAERRTRVLYVEDGIAALLADYRASK